MGTAQRLVASTLTAVAIAASPGLAAQQIALTDKITRLDGTWVLEPAKGWGGICGVGTSDELRLSVSETAISIQAKFFSQGIQSQAMRPLGVIALDGRETTL